MVNQISQNQNIVYATGVKVNDNVKSIVNGGSAGNPVDGGNSTGSTIPVANLSIYIGAVINLPPTESVITVLTPRPAANGSYTFNFTCDTQRFCFAYPASLGTVSSVKDNNGYEIISGFTELYGLCFKPPRNG